MEGENFINRSITDETHSSDIQGHQMEGERCATRSVIEELHS